jgi:hypothetical protein
MRSEATAVVTHTPYYYSEWVSHWRRQPPVEAFRAVRGKTWTECQHVREQAAMTVCLDLLGEMFQKLGQDV